MLDAEWKLEASISFEFSSMSPSSLSEVFSYVHLAILIPMTLSTHLCSPSNSPLAEELSKDKSILFCKVMVRCSSFAEHIKHCENTEEFCSEKALPKKCIQISIFQNGLQWSWCVYPPSVFFLWKLCAFCCCCWKI